MNPGSKHHGASPAQRARRLAWAVLMCLVALATLPAAPFAQAQELVRYQTAPGKSLVKIRGATNLHDWTAQGKQVLGSISVSSKNYQHLLDGRYLAGGKQPPVDLNFSIPVRSLHSNIPGLSQFMWESLNYHEHPNIIYRLSRVHYLSDEGPSSYLCRAKGKLTVNGVSKPYNFQVTFVNHRENEVEFIARGPLKLSDFGLKPPILLDGLVKSGDTIQLEVRWVLIKKPR
jgi:YceI-like protein